MIKDIQTEGKTELTALITKADVGRTAKNVPYLNLTLEDSSGILDAKYWNLTDEMAAAFHPGDIVEVKGDLIFHRNAAQLRVRSMEILENQDITAYVRQAPIGYAEMKEQINQLAAGIENPTIRSVVTRLLQMNEKDFYAYPAAVKNHHNFVGGLAYHSLTMARLAQTILEIYPFLNKDLLIAGILLHDMGKIEELSQPVLPEYTPAGNLLGHISMMNNLLDRAAVEQNVQDSEEIMLLKHMVLSHHGKLEFGSPILPMIPEAEVLTLLDNLDARMYMMKTSLDAIKPGTFGPRVFALDNRMLYRRKFDEPEEADQKSAAEPAFCHE